MKVEDRYKDGTYLARNPTWDREDAHFKAGLVASILAESNLVPASVCEVGCGAGDVLRVLRGYYPTAKLVGYDVSPQAASFWGNKENVEFVLGDFHALNRCRYDSVLMLDVFEHVRDPYTFLERTCQHADTFVFHIPLDLSAVSVARRQRLLDVRRGVGHLHFYTRDLALETLVECGYKIVAWRYTGAWALPTRRLSTRLARIPRRVLYSIHKDMGVRLLGGETLLVLARS